MIEHGLVFSRWLVSAFPPEVETVLAMPVLVLLLLLALIIVVQLLLKFEKELAPKGTGVPAILGMLFVLPEYLVTALLRAAGRQPPVIFHLYGEIVEKLVLLGQRVDAALLSVFTRRPGVRMLVVLVALAGTLAVVNARSCPAARPSCTTPVVAWWNQTVEVFDEDPPPVKPVKKPTRKPAPKKTSRG
jgi:hypothetical protein